MRITYDAQAQVAYIYLSEGSAIHATQQIADAVIVDFDAAGDAIGVELLCVDKPAVEDIARPGADAPAP